MATCYYLENSTCQFRIFFCRLFSLFPFHHRIVTNSFFFFFMRETIKKKKKALFLFQSAANAVASASKGVAAFFSFFSPSPFSPSSPRIALSAPDASSPSRGRQKDLVFSCTSSEDATRAASSSSKGATAAAEKAAATTAAPSPSSPSLPPLSSPPPPPPPPVPRTPKQSCLRCSSAR